MKLLNTFKNNINLEHKYIIAVSGGPDSMALLECALRILKKDNIKVAHVNYNKRDDAYKDEKLIIEYCQKANVQYNILNVTDEIYSFYSKINKNFQAQARNIRYDFFAKLSSKYNIKNILIGHHQNDDAETYIMQKEKNLIINYYGIRQNTKMYNLKQNFTIIRPFIKVLKKDIVLFNKENNIKFNIDKTNKQPIYRRNKIRQNLSNNDILNIIYEKEKKNNEIQTFFNKNSFKDKVLKKDFINWTADYQQRAVKKIIDFYPDLNNFIISKKSKFLFEITKQMKSNKIITFHLYKNWYIHNNNYIEIINFKKNYTKL